MKNGKNFQLSDNAIFAQKYAAMVLACVGNAERFAREPAYAARYTCDFVEALQKELIARGWAVPLVEEVE